MIRKTILVAGAIALALGLAVGTSDRSVVAADGVAGPRIAFVDIQRVLEKSVRAKEAETVLNAEQRRIEAEFEKAQKDVALGAKKLETLDPASDEFRMLKFELQLEGQRAKLQAQSDDEALKLRARNEMANIYKEIRKVVEAYATKNGIDAVLTINTGDPGGKTLPEITFEIAMRPVLYADKKFEITDAIIAALNEKK